MYLLEVLSRTNIMIILFILLIIFILITLLYILLTKNEQEELSRQSFNNKQEEKIADELTIDEHLNKNKIDDEESACLSLEELPIKKIEDKEPDLESITKELETIPKEYTFNMTPYEEEQEQKAIISYDELVKQSENGSIVYNEDYEKKDDIDDIVVKQVDLDKTGKIELDPIKKAQNTHVSISSYKHEEEFLESLKKLQEIINERS